MLSVVTFKWNVPGYRVHYTAEHANILRRMVARHYPGAHRFFCVTDDAEGLDPDIVPIPLWGDFAEMTNPHGPAYPSCYRRLRMFAPEAAETFGERFVWLDLDCVITGDLAPVWDRPEPIVLWGRTNPTTHYNGSMLLHRAGTRPELWNEFNPLVSPLLAQRARQFGSDQGWISYRLGPDEPIWGKGDGVYSFHQHLRSQGGRLPDNARIVFFHGKFQDPWDEQMQRIDWIRENYA